jgi:hypothetical protein
MLCLGRVQTLAREPGVHRRLDALGSMARGLGEEFFRCFLATQGILYCGRSECFRAQAGYTDGHILDRSVICQREARGDADDGEAGSRLVQLFICRPAARREGRDAHLAEDFAGAQRRGEHV